MDPGDLVISSKPFAYVLKNRLRGKRCDSCFERNEYLRRCTKCLFVYYCNRECQNEDWKDHKYECANLQKAQKALSIGTYVKETTRIMSRIIMKLKDPASTKCESILNVTRHFSDLLSHKEDIKKNSESMSTFMIVKYELTHLMKSSNLPSVDELFDIFGKIQTNVFEICNDALCCIGTGLYLGPSGFDHSCSPNCSIVYNGTTMEVRLLEKVSDPSLNNLFVTYCDILLSTQERRMLLKCAYFFDCKCRLCEDSILNGLSTSIVCMNQDCEHPVPIDAECCENCHTSSTNRTQEALAVMSDAEATLNRLGTVQDISRRYKQALAELEEQKMLHHLNCYRIRLLDYALDAAMKLNELKSAAYFGELTLEGYRKYGGTSPLVGIQFMSMGSIYADLHRYDKSRYYFHEAEKIIRITHASQHPLYQTLMIHKNDSDSMVLHAAALLCYAAALKDGISIRQRWD